MLLPLGLVPLKSNPIYIYIYLYTLYHVDIYRVPTSPFKGLLVWGWVFPRIFPDEFCSKVRGMAAMLAMLGIEIARQGSMTQSPQSRALCGILSAVVVLAAGFFFHRICP